MNITSDFNKKEFLIDQCLLSSIHAGVQTRNKKFPVYIGRQNLPVAYRYNYKLGETLKIEVHDFLKQYVEEIKRHGVSEEGHCDKILSLAEKLTQKLHPILFNGTFRIGVSQKIINLFLKYMWAMGEINEPCHCPIDGIVKKQIQKKRPGIELVDWTQMDAITDYQTYVRAIKEIASEEKLSVAQWELVNWGSR